MAWSSVSSLARLGLDLVDEGAELNARSGPITSTGRRLGGLCGCQLRVQAAPDALLEVEALDHRDEVRELLRSTVDLDRETPGRGIAGGIAHSAGHSRRPDREGSSARGVTAARRRSAQGIGGRGGVGHPHARQCQGTIPATGVWVCAGSVAVSS